MAPNGATEKNVKLWPCVHLHLIKYLSKSCLLSGYELEKYLAKELSNITLTVLKGRVVFEPEVVPMLIGHSHILTSGNSVKLDSGMFHRVITVGDSPAFFMYTFVNSTATYLEKKKLKPMFPIFKELPRRFYDMNRFGVVVFKSIFQVIFGCNDCLLFFPSPVML